jgi:hypothetical protein
MNTEQFVIFLRFLEDDQLATLHEAFTHCLDACIVNNRISAENKIIRDQYRRRLWEIEQVQASRYIPSIAEKDRREALEG